MIDPLANPARTASVVRDLIAWLRAAGYSTIRVDDLEQALDKIEAGGWELPKAPPYETHNGHGNGHAPLDGAA